MVRRSTTIRTKQKGVSPLLRNYLLFVIIIVIAIFLCNHLALYHALNNVTTKDRLRLIRSNNAVNSESVAAVISSLKNNNKKIEIPPDKNIVIWTYPYKPNNEKLLRKSNNTAFFCGFPSVCRQVFGSSSTDVFSTINLRTLTAGTRYESFISHHFYYKILHGKEYIHHVQSIAICSVAVLIERQGSSSSISLNHEESSARHTFSDTESRDITDEDDLIDQCRKYDPTLTDSEPLFREELDRSGPNGKNQAFAILGYDSRVKVDEDANSSNEVQALAGLQFLPEHTMTVDRDQGYTSIKDDESSMKGDESSPLLIANAWYGESIKFPPPLPTESKNNNIVFTSLHFSSNGKEIITNNKQYWEAYTSHVGPIGARDIATLKFLQDQGLSSYLSLCFTLTFQLPRSSKLVMVDQKARGDEILLVDVASSAKLPSDILARATKLECNIVGKKRWSEIGRHTWAHNLLSAYADRASVVITSRIHVALSASAMGIPVIFVEDTDLPGEDGQRAAGISNLFHIQNASEEWKYGDLSLPLPPVPGVHRIDRYRASFWKLLKERSPSTIFEETAKLYGMIPLQRLGRKVTDTEYHDLFHFIVTTKELNWKMIRAIEYVFYHHPNARVMVHCEFPDIIRDKLSIFVETGYNLVITSYNMEEMLRSFGEKEDTTVSEKDVEAFLTILPEIRKGQYWYSHKSDILRYLIIYTHGGIYLDIDVYVLRPLKKKTFVNTIGWQCCEKTIWEQVNGAFMNFEQYHSLPGLALQWTILNYNVEKIDDWGVIGPDLMTKLIKEHKETPLFSQSLTILPHAAFQPIEGKFMVDKCFQSREDLDLTNTYAIHLNNKITKDFTEMEAGIPCNEILHRFCIFCHEIHTIKSSDSTKSSVVTFPEIE